ncbi:MAG: SpoIIE family protein phosphatase [Thermoanaerobaculia bacterium]|nr:SpoIIE family protein phosphatase [Thermoanaerobaculia bacterium]
MAATPGERPGRILVVDDVEMNRDMLSRRLQKQGYEAEMAVNGVDALAKLSAGEFDLVLLDIMMPEMDGYEVLTRVKSDEALRHIPVIMISAVEDIESVVRCIELGADDYLPKPFNPVILRARVTSSLDKKKLRDRERLYAASLERELEIGREIQKGFFPETIPAIDGWEIAARFESAKQVAGDFYDAFPLDGGATMIVVADVCGKGVGAALYMALFRSLLRAVATAMPADASPSSVLDRAARVTNDYIATTHESSSMFATAFLGVIDPAAAELHYINCGHEAPLVVMGGAVRARLAPTGPALGLMPGLPFTVATEPIGAGETVVLFTDGVTEASGAAGFFGDERLVEVLRSSSESASALLGTIVASVHAHAAGFEPSDDITLLAIRRQ